MSNEMREAVRIALVNLEIDNGEGGFYRLLELLDFSGENQARIVVSALADAAIAAARPHIEREGLPVLAGRWPPPPEPANHEKG